MFSDAKPRDKIEIQLDARRLVTDRRIAEAEHQRVMLAEHLPMNCNSANPRI